MTPTESAPLRGSCLLVIDDEDIVRVLTIRMLRQAGFPVVEVPDAEAALRLLSDRRFSCSLVITDVRMPTMSGVELAEELAESRPDVPVLFVSGFPEPSMTPLTEVASRAFLAKPYQPEELLTVVGNLVNAHARGSSVST
jgi:two-component system cell cycle sensor histidine kinase/response regulator CckA